MKIVEYLRTINAIGKPTKNMNYGLTPNEFPHRWKSNSRVIRGER